MNGYLLDTNVILFTLVDDIRLSSAMRDAIATGPNYLSLASYWEVLIKSMKGKLDVGDPRAWWPQALKQMVAVPLAVRSEHLDQLYSLPPIHSDPFDRILIAQASAEELTLVTADAEIQRYASEGVKVIF